ncbi:MAG TPA: tRNA (adenosine(37)-N6)-threonylcarbamoyltransferase complex transferase subunit TsaD [Acidobacteriota bacterium]|jgi:N6-L-threonylcarbamoyladenine synthase|nr:tRNA (adenosine(37)-N6)-threonylcarbamoyltransferase complex transferase subunit TsaD [Acidobacteriota bacterium]
MLVLGIESSCDETAAAVVESGGTIRSSVVASQVRIHQDYGGVVPELASREHVDNICFVVRQALEEAGVAWDELSGVGVTRGPGLVGALLVGLAYAKAVAFSRNLPLVGVNHLEGHMYSVFLDHPQAETPSLSLVVSGGHTNLYHVEAVGRYRLLAKSRDDAAGESLDKLAKFLGLGYPGGPVIERLAREGNPETFRFTIPTISSGTLDFSYSGLKTAALRYGRSLQQDRRTTEDPASEQKVNDLAASFQKAVIDQLIDRTLRAAQQYEVRSIHVSGGVSCNQALRTRFLEVFGREGLPVYFPRPELTTDNAAMIAGAALLHLSRGRRDGWDLAPDPNLVVEDFPPDGSPDES